MLPVDKTYRKEKILDWEIKSLQGKYSFFFLTKKTNWRLLGLIMLGLSVFAFILPYAPPRYGWSQWSPPTTFDEYKTKLNSFLIFIPTIILLLFAFINLRFLIDRMLGIKWVANFKVTNVLNIGARKIVILNNWRLFSIGPSQQYYNSVALGQMATVKRTGTFMFIDWYIREEKL